MTLNDNKIDYIHWDDPNELVDRFRLLEVSRHNAIMKYCILSWSFVKLALL